MASTRLLRLLRSGFQEAVQGGGVAMAEPGVWNRPSVGFSSASCRFGVLERAVRQRPARPF
jgi:hypothetical protein